jgi:glutamate racemase
MAPTDSVGIFDSGVGGLSVWREIVRQLPAENTLYVADQAHVPYGSRSLAEVREYAAAITRFLLRGGAKVVVIACNTASAAALHDLRRRFPHVPFVGMEPAVKPAVERTRSGVIGVIATRATFQGALFASLLERYAGDVQVLTQVCPGLVEVVEGGSWDGPEAEALLRACLAPLRRAGIDELVLGCTHYPFLRATIERILGPAVEVIDPAPAVARQTGRVLDHYGLRANGRRRVHHTGYTSGDPRALERVTAQLRATSTLQVARVRWQDGTLRVTRT